MRMQNRFSIEEKGNQSFLLDGWSHQVFELNESSVCIFKNYLQGLDSEECAQDLSERFEGLDTETALKEVEEFFHLLKTRQLLNSGTARSHLPPLRKITFAVTARCNLTCKHCFGASTLESREDFPLELFKKIISEIHSLGIRSITLFGGEPFMRKDIWELMDYLRSSRVLFQINTNATLLDKASARRLKEQGVVNVTASLDGSVAEVHDALRGSGNFQRALAGIRALVEAGIPVLLSTIVTHLNAHDLDAMVQKALELKVKNIRFNEIHFSGNAECFEKEMALTKEEREKVYNEVSRLKKKYGDFILGSWPEVCSLIQKRKPEKPASSPVLIVPPCGAAMGSLCIRPDGGVTPCEILWDTVCGNVKESSLQEIYYESEGMNAFRRPLILGQEELGKCRECALLKTCFTGHRCAPYFFKGASLEEKALKTCWARD